MTTNIFSFKSQFSFRERLSESRRIMEKYPDKLPIICEKNSNKEPNISKSKYLVAVDLKISQFIFVIRSKLNIDASQAIYLFVNSDTLVTSNTYIATIYELYKDDDGFLYLNYAFENTFGNESNL